MSNTEERTAVEAWAEIPLYVVRGFRQIATRLGEDGRRPDGPLDAVYLATLVVSYAGISVIASIIRAIRRQLP